MTEKRAASHQHFPAGSAWRRWAIHAHAPDRTASDLAYDIFFQSVNRLANRSIAHSEMVAYLWLGRVVKLGHRYRAFFGETTSMKFDPLKLMQRVRSEVALTAIRATILSPNEENADKCENCDL